MIPLPKDFNVEVARRLLIAKLDAIPQAQRAVLLESADAPVYRKFLEVCPPTTPARERFAGDSLLTALEGGDPAAFDVATDVIGRALPPDEVVGSMTALLTTQPWKRLRDRALEAAGALGTEAGFRLLLDQPAAGSVIRRNTFAGGAALALERLRRSPAIGLSFSPLTRAAAAALSKVERDRRAEERRRAAESLDPWEVLLVQDLVSYLAERGSVDGMEIARRLVDTHHPSDELRGRAAVSLHACGRIEDLELLAGFLEDDDGLIRSTAIRSILALDLGAAWERLGGDALLDPGRSVEASELLYELGRDLASVRNAPVQGWARADARFAGLARHWRSDRKVGKHAEWVLAGLASSG